MSKKLEELNKFSEVEQSLSAKMNPPPVTYRHFPNICVNSKNSFFLATTNAYEIQLFIKNLKMKFSSSSNDIPHKFLKIASCIA